MNNPLPASPIRLWPAILILAFQWFAWLVLPSIFPDAALYGLLAGVLGGAILLLIWWLFFSRIPWSERLTALALIAIGLAITRLFLLHPSIATGGMGFLFFLYAIPVLCLALVAWAAFTRLLSVPSRRLALPIAIFLACCVFTLLRTGGVSGEGQSDFHWRWTPTPEERLLASADSTPSSTTKTDASGNPALLWPGFRGAARNSILPGVRIATDWAQSPPTKMWQRAVGPAWSSFAVQGDLLYTQEQRGEDELVTCYRVSTGQPVWTHRDAARFWESNAGAGPRATPTLHDDCVYTLGATGIANALAAADGKLLWSHNAASDSEAKLPEWAFAGSPLVHDKLVIFSVAGRLAAYDRATGKLQWTAKSGGAGYSSPHSSSLGGMTQLLLLNTAGLVSFDPASGKELWKFEWKGDGIVQPGFTADGDLLLGSGSGLNANTGLQRVTVATGANGWTTTPRWMSKGLRPYYSDFVVHHGHAYGFDSGILACVNLADGQRTWKGGRFGHGQLLLLPEQNLLLILSEKGELALVNAAPQEFKQLARLPAIEGKTWNHPVLAGEILLVRNDQEMAAFRFSQSKPNTQ